MKWYMNDFVTLKNARVRLLRYGEGKPLLLLPGWPFSSTIYSILEPFLKDEYEVTCIDLPGWCGNSTFKKNQQCRVQDYLRIIHECIEKVYKHDELIDVGGISIGGTLALLLSSQRENIKNVFVQSSPYRGDYFIENRSFKTRLMEEASTSIVLGNLLKYFYRVQHMRTYRKNKRNLSKTTIDEILSEYSKLIPRCVLEFACDFFHSDYSQNLKQITNKVYIAACQSDTFVSTQFMRELADLLPNSVYLEIPGVSHYFIAEDPKRFAELFLDKE